MSKYIPDILSKRWVIISPHRTLRPDDQKDETPACIFCPGSEHLTGPEVLRLGGGEANKPGWKVRVIPNKYPITDYHEVIIHSPEEDKNFESLPVEDVALIIQAYKHRYDFYRNKGTVIIFCNEGEHAGASIKHPHSQLVVLPFQITLDSLSREPMNNMVDENNLFHVYCPDFSQWPYEVWLAPKRENTHFGDITDEEATDLAQLLYKTIKRLLEIYNENKNDRWLTVPFGYNFYIHPRENWFLRIIPRFIHRAGFELGTGLSVNIIDPADAAKELALETADVK